ncbi:MAG: hypothetical protein ABS46_14920 [Cytophagaceae bacterium SCN 52-12]|nr:MAG: hypothetical protein ABS46_14920 [Cytophagaceae bacterium SCN 52-12]
MVTKTESLAAKALWSLAILITFLLLFEKEIVLPAWLQSFGRMHPLLLHFPIVLTMLATGLQLYGHFRGGSIAQNHLRILWLSSALTAGITVLMGLFLSQEDGYEGLTLSWHKWTGIGVFYLASLFYFFFTFPGLSRLRIAVLGMTGLLLVVSGHFGAELTHGEGFISQPIQKSAPGKQVPIEQALVFEHVILPVFEAKCTGCHNPDKLKGGLILTDSASVARGGKTGPLIEPYQPSLSLLLDRIHLSPDDKKHMPPKGKPQLTPEEEAVLLAWIKAGTPYNARVTGISARDSLGILARKRLNSGGAAEEAIVYDFKAADPETIKSLNSEYRNIAPFAYNSPALSVDLYGSRAYSPALLEELNPLKTQVVSLNLSRMPATDEDLKLVTAFENLRQLNLNFTGITSKGLAQLSGLKHLQTLYLAGTRLDPAELRSFLAKSKSLKNVTLWDTEIKGEDLSAAKKEFPGISFLSDFNPDDTTRLRLNKPLAKTDNWVFDKSTRLELYHPVRGVRLHYTLDGADPDSLSPQAGGPVIVEGTTVVRVRGYKEGWYPSDIAEFQLFRNTYKPDSVFMLTRLNRVHLAEGAHTFFDKRLGAIGANNPAWANYFAGVRDNDLQLLCWFDKAPDLKTVGFRIMVEEETGIYPPGIIEIWGGENENRLHLVAKQVTPKLPEPREKPTLQKIELPVKSKSSLKCLKIVLKPFQRPNERPKLILIDEMFLN